MTDTKLPIDSIRVESRFRKTLGDLELLAESIAKIGVLHPVLVTPDGGLICGQRRIEACRLLGWEAVPVRIVDLDEPLQAQHDENACRLDFAPSERVAIAAAMGNRERASAKTRQEITRARPGERVGERGENFSPPSPVPKHRGKSRDILASRVGWSGPTLEKAAAVVKAAEREPEKFRAIVEEMDRTGRVHGAYRKLVEAKMLARVRAEEVSPPTGKYRCITIDPPWPMDMILREGSPTGGGVPYATMTLDEIRALPIADIINNDGAHIFLWTTHRFLPDAFALFAAWGIRYQCLMTWVKDRGYTPASFQYTTEHVLFGRVGNLPLLKTGERLDFSAKRREHSRKPDEFYQLVERVSPGPRIDMFGRQSRAGWTIWGNEAGKFDCAAAP